MPKKLNAAPKPVKTKGVRAENAASSASAAGPRRTKEAAPPKVEASARKPTRAVAPPALKPVTDTDAPPTIQRTALYGASWVPPPAAMLSTLSDDDTLLLRGISPGSTSAQWYWSLSQQLSQRAMGSAVETDRRPSSANAALMVPHALIKNAPSACSQPPSPVAQAEKTESAPPEAEPQQASGDRSGAHRHQAEEEQEPSSVSSHPSSRMPSDPAPTSHATQQPALHKEEETEALPIWLRAEDDDSRPPSAVGSPPLGHGDERRRTDFDRLQSLRRMMEVNGNAGDSFSSESSVRSAVEEAAQLLRHADGHAKAKGHHLPPLPLPSRAHADDPISVEIVMSHTSESSSPQWRRASPHRGQPSEDGDSVQTDEPQPGKVLDWQAVRSTPEKPAAAPSGRVVVLSLGGLAAGGRPQDGKPLAPSPMADPLVQHDTDISPVKRMAPGLREKRQLALIPAKGAHKRRLPPLS